MQSNICKVYVCLAVTCHLLFWQNDRDLLCATAGMDTEIRVSTESRPWRRKFSQPLLWGFEPRTFQSQVQHSNHWDIAVPSLLSTWPNSLKFTNQPGSYALLLMLPFFVFALCACTHLIRDLFLMLHHLSGTFSLAKLDHQTNWHLSNNNW